ncbi:MAG TPA: flagellar cap protein FliD N-terminal domain-containing protein, partial [Paraburkholderia sp.]|uniref:flagellar cap protein FliD N-terminal domain-containing protein n=1 Tax=Paraburkholderia sp. TaxID=1926495 RepID=UPI002DE44AA3|nr:flagellar cap protein FliD N-terminal domain-containing protein [Paraburkholderia sp.]
MSTVNSTASTIASTVAATTASSNAALQEAAQSIISGSTGNSSMDVSSLVSALVNSKIAGQAATIAASQSTDNTQISAYGTLSAALSALQASLGTLSDGTTVNSFSATMSGTGITATAATGAVAGSYSLDVAQVATAQVLTSKGYSPATQALATGPATMTLTVNGASTTISLNSSNSTVSGIASAINSASNNPGVTATVVNGADGAHLVLHSTSTGSSNGISIAVSDAVASDPLNGLAVTTASGQAITTSSADASALASNQSTLTYTTVDSSGNSTTVTGAKSTGAWTQTTPAQDAYFTIDGTGITSS